MSFFRIAWLLNYISIASFSAAIITPALPEIQKQYALLHGPVEWIVSTFLMGYVIGQLIYGPLANHLGRIKALRIGLIINLIGILICCMGLYVHSYPILIIGRLITALGAASGLACTFMLINEWVPAEQRRTTMACTILSFTGGIGVAVILGGMVTEYSHWSYCFLILLAHGLIMLYGTRIFSETLITAQPINLNSIIKGYKIALLSGELVTYSLVVGLCSAIGYCFSAAGPLIAMDLFGLSPAEYGYWNGFNMVGMLAGGLLAKTLLGKYDARLVVILGLVGTALGLSSLILMIYCKNFLVLWFFSSTLTMYLFSGLLFSGGSYLASSAITDKASGSAMMSFINMATAVLVVIIMGYISTDPLFAFVWGLGGLWLFVILVLLIQLTGNSIVTRSNQGSF